MGFALQDTLGNLFSGLAIQIEKPFRVGDWVTIGAQEGSVSEITWRATKLLTKAGNFVVVPNSVMAKDTITNYSVPTRQMRLHVDVGVSYDVPPNFVKSVIAEALKNASELSAARPAEIMISDFAGSAITYRVRFWVDDFDAGRSRARSGEGRSSTTHSAGTTSRFRTRFRWRCRRRKAA